MRSLKVTKPLLSLSLDLDDKWSYLKTHGDPSWASLPSYLGLVVPRILGFLAARKLKITFFVVGQDADVPRNRPLFAEIAGHGHEIANHSFHHEPWLQAYSEERFEAELAKAEEAIEAATGRRTVGFRGPGFSLSEAGPRVLARRGYLYDASTFPTFVGPLARAYTFLHSRYTREQKKERAALFGSLRDAVRPNTPYILRGQGTPPIVEIPVTTLPFLRIPIHVSYVMYLATVSPALAVGYFGAALALCRATGVQPSVLLHPTDFLRPEEAPEMAYFPAMRLPIAIKQRVLEAVVQQMTDRFEVVTMEAHAAAVVRRAGATAIVREGEPTLRGDAPTSPVRLGGHS